MLNKYVRQRRFYRFGAIALLSVVVFLCIAPFVFAQISGGQEEKTVNDFADFWVKILSGHVSKIIAVVLLLSAVLSLFKGQVGVAISCGVGFLLLMFIPKMITGLFK